MSSFLCFGLVGAFATLIHVSIFMMLVEIIGVSPVLASIPSFLVAMLFSYAANHRWTFQASTLHAIYLPRFSLVSVTGMSINVFITYMVVNLLGLEYGVALVMVVTSIPILTYLLNKNWTFKD